MNLIICCTPLHVLIAEKIIQEYPNESFYGVMLSTTKNEKFDHYSQRLAARCKMFFSMVQHKDRLSLFKEIFTLKFKFKGERFNRVFLANINDLQIQFLLSAVCFDELNTFDDGTVNIIQCGLLYDDTINIKRKIVNKLLGNRYSTQKIRQSIHCHYSIYPGHKNLIENVKPIKLMDKALQAVEYKEEKSISILLGQPIYLEDKDNINLATEVIKKFDIDYYLPHPREKYKIEGVDYLNTPFILEDYILQNATQKRMKVYTYFSSGVLNIQNISPNIEVIALRVDVTNPDYLACYNLFERFGIPIIDIRA